MPTPRQARASADGARSGVSSRSKRAEILAIATEYFGEHGYEDTKWADVAAAVGIGSTALYHYFESKLHCLYVIMADALEGFQGDFERITSEHDDFLDALVAVIRSGWELTDHEVLRLRLLVAEQGLVGVHRRSPREEEARQLARARTRELEFSWGTFLTRGMEQGILPEADPRLLTRAMLGLYNSVWHWFRPRGTLSLAEVADFYMRRQLVLLGLSPDLLDGARPATRARAVSGAKRARSAPRAGTASAATKRAR
ncbi:MAG TPA: TetR family transcriptional regulator [Solirubrobacteraceae bacterium]|nr:TetR family transcriptional regulator [Solirubrobacteraceae bacterium]